MTEPWFRLDQHRKVTRVQGLPYRLLGDPFGDHVIQSDDTELSATLVLIRMHECRLVLGTRNDERTSSKEDI